MKTPSANLPLVAIDDHGHSFHVDAFLHDPLETCLQLLVEGREMFCWDGADVNRDVDECRTDVF